jgi:hypothetical protein
LPRIQFLFLVRQVCNGSTRDTSGHQDIPLFAAGMDREQADVGDLDQEDECLR